MKALLLTHGTYLQPDNIVVGNSGRAYYLSKGLLDNGIDVDHVYPEEQGSPIHNKEYREPLLTPLLHDQLCYAYIHRVKSSLVIRHSP